MSVTSCKTSSLCNAHIPECEQRAVEEEDDAEEHKQPTERRQRDTNFCGCDEDEPAAVGRVADHEAHFDRL